MISRDFRNKRSLCCEQAGTALFRYCLKMIIKTRALSVGDDSIRGEFFSCFGDVPRIFGLEQMIRGVYTVTWEQIPLIQVIRPAFRE